jgi:hypothetical protein
MDERHGLDGVVNYSRRPKSEQENSQES